MVQAWLGLMCRAGHPESCKATVTQRSKRCRGRVYESFASIMTQSCGVLAVGVMASREQRCVDPRQSRNIVLVFTVGPHNGVVHPVPKAVIVRHGRKTSGTRSGLQQQAD